MKDWLVLGTYVDLGARGSKKEEIGKEEGDSTVFVIISVITFGCGPSVRSFLEDK